MGESNRFDKVAKSSMRLMLGLSAIVASVASVIGAITYMTTMRRNAMPEA